MNFVEPIPSLPADVHDPFALLCSGRNFVRCWMSRGEDTPLEVVCVNQSGGAKPAAKPVPLKSKELIACEKEKKSLLRKLGECEKEKQRLCAPA